MVQVRELRSVDDFHTFKDLQGDELHIVKLSAPWCGPCRALGETIRNLDVNKIGSALFAEIDIDTDETESVGIECGIRGVPVLLFYKNGEEVKRINGNITAAALYDAINELSD
jgi:thioredoxin 1